MKSLTKSFIMSLTLATSLAHAGNGDRSVETQTQLTDNSAILEIGNCNLVPKSDFDGQAYLTVELQYAVCEQYVTYEVDVLEKRFWQKEYSNPRNHRTSNKVAVRSYSNSNQFTQSSDQNKDLGTVMLESMVDSARLLQECESKKQGLEMAARQNNPEFVRSCRR